MKFTLFVYCTLYNIVSTCIQQTMMRYVSSRSHYLGNMMQLKR